jgi:hypothetical protein
MTLEQLGNEYLKQAEDIKGMIESFSALKKGASGIELYEINNRLTILREMERDTRITGHNLIEYYDKKSNKKSYRSHCCN